MAGPRAQGVEQHPWQAGMGAFVNSPYTSRACGGRQKFFFFFHSEQRDEAGVGALAARTSGTLFLVALTRQERKRYRGEMGPRPAQERSWRKS